MAYKFLEHTADVMFEAEGKTLEELFLECTKALNETIHGNLEILNQKTENIEIKSDSLESLLYKFLEEFLFLLDSKDLIFGSIKNISITEDSFILKAELGGDSAEKYHFTNDVKAITFHNLKITKEKDLYKTKVILDV